MKSIQKEIADIRKTTKAFSALLDQIEKRLTGKKKEKKGAPKRKKISRKRQDDLAANPPLAETGTSETAE
ncbi:MAG: hypothetical protein ABIK15_17685 [Pseudomonadota bacterium]